MARSTWAAGLAACLFVAPACGGDDEADEVRPLVGEIAPAIEALEASLGGPQEYLEVNATPQFVNLFVAVDGGPEVVGYLYVDGELAPPADQGESDAATFAAADLDFDPDEVLSDVLADLPDSHIVVFSAIEGPAGAMEYVAMVESSKGGIIDVTVGPDGATLAVDPRGPDTEGSAVPSTPASVPTSGVTAPTSSTPTS